jgi:nicotinate phosphoribosyltransferase
VAGGAADLESIRVHAAQEFARLPRRIRDINPADPPYPVTVSAALEGHYADVRHLVSGRPK